MLRKPEDIKRFLQERKEINKRKKEKEKQRYKKASQRVKKLLNDKYIKETKQTPEKPLKYTYSLTIYQSHQVEREPNEDNLYSLYELQHIEELFPEEEGRINWIIWNKIIDKYRKTL